jgi:hypothetical protein
MSLSATPCLCPNTDLCHDYPPQGRDPVWKTTVAQERASNIHVHDGVTEAEFVALRNARDKTLSMPGLISKYRSTRFNRPDMASALLPR